MCTHVQKTVKSFEIATPDNKMKQEKIIHSNYSETDLENPFYNAKDKQKATEAYPLGGSEEEIKRVLRLKPGDQERTDFFTNIAEHHPDDHSVIKSTKDNIKRLLDEELEFLGFTEQLKKEEESALIEDTFDQIEERSSFFYKFDANKVHTNLKINDVQAPGNIFRKPSIVAPHEHIHPQHYIDAETMTQQDVHELYSLYTFYIDLHVSQVRKDIDDKSYINPQLNQIYLVKESDFNHALDNRFFEYYHRWRENPDKWYSQTQEIDHWALLDSLPEDPHPDERKINKHEIEWTDDQKFPHVANRKGYPVLAEEPLERIFQFERAQAHPSYQMQAFVQTPSMDPDPSLSFEKAETIYENKAVGEWVRLWTSLLAIVLPFWPAFFTFEIYQADNVPSIDWATDMSIPFAPVPKQFQDTGDLDLEKMRYCDDHDYMNMQYAMKKAVIRPAHTMYQFAILTTLINLNFEYATKVVYNKDKDMVFVYKPAGIFKSMEYVYEVHHLESPSPPPIGSYQHLGVGKKDGIISLFCMDTNQTIKLYNDPKYWNLELRDEFLSQTRSLWLDLTDKYEGKVVTICPKNSKDMTEMVEKVHEELDAAFLKHGEATPIKTYPQQVRQRLIESRDRIATAATG